MNAAPRLDVVEKIVCAKCQQNNYDIIDCGDPDCPFAGVDLQPPPGREIRVLHIGCGGQVGWWHGSMELGARVNAEEFEFMDGTYPEPNDNMRIICPRCAQLITTPHEIERVPYHS